MTTRCARVPLFPSPQMDALDKFVFTKKCHAAFDIALKIENATGSSAKNRLTRQISSKPNVSTHTCSTLRPSLRQQNG